MEPKEEREEQLRSPLPDQTEMILEHVDGGDDLRDEEATEPV